MLLLCPTGKTGTAARRCRITLTCERDKVFPTSHADGKMFRLLFSGGSDVGKGPIRSSVARKKPTANGSVRTKQQMRGVRSLNFLKLNNSRKQSTQKTGSGLLQSGSEERPGSSSPTWGETTREASHGLGFVTSVNLPWGLVGRGGRTANARKKKAFSHAKQTLCR